MGFEELFNQDNRRERFSQNRQFGNDDNNQTQSSYNQMDGFKQQIMDKLHNNPKLKGMLMAVAIVLLVVVITMLFLLLPLIMKLLGFITENGVQGVLDVLWKGTK